MGGRVDIDLLLFEWDEGWVDACEQGVMLRCVLDGVLFACPVVPGLIAHRTFEYYHSSIYRQE